MKIAFALLLAFVAAAQAEYEFAIACEGYDATLQCADGKKILVNTAVFGRTQEHVCGTKRGNLNCVASTSQAVVEAYCGVRTSNACVVKASTNIFGEPCSGVNKYLQIAYQCV